MSEDILMPGAIMLPPVGRSGANYRDTIPELGRDGPPDTAFSPMYLPSALGVPHLIIPSAYTYLVQAIFFSVIPETLNYSWSRSIRIPRLG